MRGRRALVEREDRGQEQAQPPRNPHDHGVRRHCRRRGNGMGASRGRHHPGRARRQRPPGRHRFLEALARNLDLSICPRSIYLSNRPVAAKIAADAIRKHWGIENKSHYTRDVTFREDASRIRTNPGIFARLRTIAYNVLRCSQSETMPRDQPIVVWRSQEGRSGACRSRRDGAT